MPSRAQQLTHLSQGTEDNPYDVLIIGGGATGTGCAVDAATRCLAFPCIHQLAGPFVPLHAVYVTELASVMDTDIPGQPENMLKIDKVSGGGLAQPC